MVSNCNLRSFEQPTIDVLHLHRLTSSMSFYRSLLGIRSIRAVSETELHLEYDVPQGPIILVMKFDELTKRLADAAVSFAILTSLCYEGHKTDCNCTI